MRIFNFYLLLVNINILGSLAAIGSMYVISFQVRYSDNNKTKQIDTWSSLTNLINHCHFYTHSNLIVTKKTQIINRNKNKIDFLFN